ncbi:GntR family transcriptional regulator [Nocardioides sp. GY 10127]|uniref:GntR family transcriptional regulator n=1 Tax=Nocardioides sp. GY 10127 TaxID=2569762 RepID=UPI0010A7E0AA|nr:GntR family transcriptional regulator [Nocardioides sp. GY 10127]TIC81566.1 GntR family transcriptional regulator [Nocardioides sp. GY 10127]
MAEDRTIDRSSPVPYYRQLADALGRQVATGDLTTGQRLPSEAELCGRYGLSRATVRQALAHLEQQGVARRVAGRGVFVHDGAGEQAPTGWQVDDPATTLEGALGSTNPLVEIEVRSHGQVTLPTWATRLLEVPDGTTGHELVRLHLLDGTPALLSTRLQPPPVDAAVAAAEPVLRGAGSLTAALAAAGWAAAGTRRSLHAMSPRGAVAEALEAGPQTPVLRIRAVSWTRTGLLHDAAESWVRTDVAPLDVTLGTPR